MKGSCMATINVRKVSPNENVIPGNKNQLYEISVEPEFLSLHKPESSANLLVRTKEGLISVKYSVSLDLNEGVV
jgi:hypothetical protein